MQQIVKLWRTLGPGFLYAGAAVGVSHLVQSTKAGAAHGMTLLVVVLAANLFKYPFFEAGPRYAAATGQSLVQGYARIGPWAVWLFTLLTASTAFIVQATVTIVTAALFAHLVGFSLGPLWDSLLLLALCAAILLAGKYRYVDALVKWVVILLTLSTIIALVRAYMAPAAQVSWPAWAINGPNLVFLFALIGWMPAPIDLAAWHSLWTLEKIREAPNHVRLKESLRDFHIGYWGTALLAAVFLALGALVLYPTGANLSALGGAEFSARFVGIYTSTLGQWTYPIIAFAAFATMFSTTITVLDGAPRLAAGLVPALTKKQPWPATRTYTLALLGIAIGALLIIALFGGNNVFATLIQMATLASFLTAPLMAWLNHRLVYGPHMPPQARPARFHHLVSVLGLVFLTLFALTYLLYLIGAIKP
jgi:Mn2+/Fe2+ NRAMP family transporter